MTASDAVHAHSASVTTATVASLSSAPTPMEVELSDTRHLTGDGPTGDGPTGDGLTGERPTGDGPTSAVDVEPHPASINATVTSPKTERWPIESSFDARRKLSIRGELHGREREKFIFLSGGMTRW